MESNYDYSDMSCDSVEDTAHLYKRIGYVQKNFNPDHWLYNELENIKDNFQMIFEELYRKLKICNNKIKQMKENLIKKNYEIKLLDLDYRRKETKIEELENFLHEVEEEKERLITHYEEQSHCEMESRNNNISILSKELTGKYPLIDNMKILEEENKQLKHEKDELIHKIENLRNIIIKKDDLSNQLNKELLLERCKSRKLSVNMEKMEQDKSILIADIRGCSTIQQRRPSHFANNLTHLSALNLNSLNNTDEEDDGLGRKQVGNIIHIENLLTPVTNNNDNLFHHSDVNEFVLESHMNKSKSSNEGSNRKPSVRNIFMTPNLDCKIIFFI